MDRTTSNSHSATILRFRLDRTVKTGVPVKYRICNLSCIWCHHDYMSHTRGSREAISNQDFVENLMRIVDIVQPYKTFARISGDGEPTLVGEEELTDLIMRLRVKPHIKQIKLTTNGLMLGQFAPSLKSAGLDSVTVSINSMDRDTYAFYSGVDALSLVMNSIEEGLETGLNIKLNIIYSRLNNRETNEFISYAHDHPQVILKFFELIPSNDLTKRLHLPLVDLEKRLEPISHKIVDFSDAYVGKSYFLWNGGQIQIKTSGINNCPKMDCTYRAVCLEGCRTSVRLRVDGILQPCGVRRDNSIDLLSPSTTDESIVRALQSGGKLV